MDMSLLGIVSGFYDASMDRRMWPQTLRRLADACGARTAAIAVHDYETGAGRLMHWAVIDPDYLASYETRYARRNVWLQSEEHFRSPGAVWTGQQIVSDTQLMATDFYREWLVPQNLLHHLFGILDRRGSVVTVLVFARAEGDGAFGDKEITLLRLLMPKLRRGFEAGQAFRRAQDVQRIAIEALDAMPVGVLILNESGGVLGANKGARRIVDSGDVLTIGEDGLAVDWGWRRLRFRDLLVGERGKGGGRRNRVPEVPAFTIARGGRLRPISVVVVPIGEGDGGRSGGSPAAIVYVGDPDQPAEIDPARLSQIYGLSRAEARVVALLATGQRLDEVAENLGVAYETVRKHLKQVFAKTGTDRQAELVRVLVTGPAGLRL